IRFAVAPVVLKERDVEGLDVCSDPRFFVAPIEREVRLVTFMGRSLYLVCFRKSILSRSSNRSPPVSETATVPSHGRSSIICSLKCAVTFKRISWPRLISESSSRDRHCGSLFSGLVFVCFINEQAPSAQLGPKIHDKTTSG